MPDIVRTPCIQAHRTPGLSLNRPRLSSSRDRLIGCPIPRTRPFPNSFPTQYYSSHRKTRRSEASTDAEIEKKEDAEIACLLELTRSESIGSIHIIRVTSISFQPLCPVNRNEDLPPATVYRNPRSVISMFSAFPIQRMLLHLLEQLVCFTEKTCNSRQLYR